MLGEKDGSFSTTGWTQIETLAGEGPEVVMPAFGVGTADARDALEIVAARRKAPANFLDMLNAVSSVGGGVLLIVLLAEVSEMPLEYCMELVPPTGNVPVRRHARDRDCRAHMNVYGRKWLCASDSETDIERHITHIRAPPVKRA